MTVPSVIRCDYCGWPTTREHVWGWTVAPGKTLCPLCATILGSKPVVCHLYPQDETPKEAGQ
ncbi:hypothetical protein O8W32_06650 [Methanomassiliicoccales archaeon LGM-DZ1]|nr:hypothetical protein O8W32_06650 [Methanomassiliicoccales archaeon LGM-DZ1]